MPHILIVEDDTDINNSTAEYLRRKGCLCSQAFSGTEGRLLWQAGGVDLLLVDLMLPGLSGSELIAEIRKGVKPGEPVEVGTYRGFAMALSVEDFGRTFVLTLKGQMTHRAELGDDVLGNLLRIDHALNKMPDRVTALHSQLDNLHQQMKEIQGEIGKPFPQETELQQKSARLAELNRQLGINDEQAPVGEQLLEKDARPSVLEGLKRPVQPKQKTDKLKEHHQER